MAHTVNFNMKSYDLIYTDIRKILHGDDLSFVNVETPVCDSLELSTYPRFNVHTPYLRAAAEAGFDILSLANNHTNDQQTTGIDGTLQAVKTVQKERNTLDNPHPPLVFSGLKDTVDDSISVTRITYKGWNILYCAVTEILNSHDASKKRLYYSAPTKRGREALLAILKKARTAYPCDLFILGLHLDEPEYVRTVSEAKKAWFKRLGEAGVDIIWAHHPHVMQTWETITVERTQPVSTDIAIAPTAAWSTADIAARFGIASGAAAQNQEPRILGINAAVGAAEYLQHAHTAAAQQTDTLVHASATSEAVKPPVLEQITVRRSVFCMYSMGNFISGQRWHTRFDNPTYYREYTGDAVLLQLICTKKDTVGVHFSITPHLITQYNEPEYPVVKRFTQEWIDTLSEKEKKYFRQRFELMKAYLPL